ncbi:hypothetical protein Gotri_012596 [Gossypium trilobum]|uniref:Reverse transcriptase n=1 Tax=Gossypium trilobum TaxID=34281 RepID=A0A7J9DQU1_9ROSI|nr:hypothetical protein [Gossypium trilobum]
MMAESHCSFLPNSFNQSRYCLLESLGSGSSDQSTRHLKDLNTSFMMKVGFSIISNVNSLWVRVLRPNNMIAGDGLWNLDIFQLWVSEEVINKTQRLLTNAERVRRGIGSSSACGLCGQDFEDVLHVLRDCPAPRSIWDKLIPQQRLSSFYIESLIDWVCLRTDGSIKIDEGFAATGGFVRDHNGRWIVGFSKYLGNCTVMEAELWGILEGLNIMLYRRF